MSERPLRRLPVNLDELAYVLHESDQFGTTRHYLDLDTGEIVMITDEIRAEAEQIGELIPVDVEDFDAAFEEVLANSDRPDWMKDSIRLADTNARLQQIWQEMQKELVGLSSSSSRVIATQAGHDIPNEEPELLVDAILKLVSDGRNR